MAAIFKTDDDIRRRVLGAMGQPSSQTMEVVIDVSNAPPQERLSGEYRMRSPTNDTVYLNNADKDWRFVVRPRSPAPYYGSITESLSLYGLAEVKRVLRGDIDGDGDQDYTVEGQDKSGHGIAIDFLNSEVDRERLKTARAIKDHSERATALWAMVRSAQVASSTRFDAATELEGSEENAACLFLSRDISTPIGLRQEAASWLTSGIDREGAPAASAWLAIAEDPAIYPWERITAALYLEELTKRGVEGSLSAAEAELAWRSVAESLAGEMSLPQHFGGRFDRSIETEEDVGYFRSRLVEDVRRAVHADAAKGVIALSSKFSLSWQERLDFVSSIGDLRIRDQVLAALAGEESLGTNRRLFAYQIGDSTLRDDALYRLAQDHRVRYAAGLDLIDYMEDPRLADAARVLYVEDKDLPLETRKAALEAIRDDLLRERAQTVLGHDGSGT